MLVLAIVFSSTTVYALNKTQKSIVEKDIESTYKKKIKSSVYTNSTKVISVTFEDKSKVHYKIISATNKKIVIQSYNIIKKKATGVKKEIIVNSDGSTDTTTTTSNNGTTATKTETKDKNGNVTKSNTTTTKKNNNGKTTTTQGSTLGIDLSDLSKVDYSKIPEYYLWKQGDSPWGGAYLNNVSGSNNNTIGNSGCYITSMACALAISGVVSQDTNKFNPGVFNQDCAKQGLFSGVGSIGFGGFGNLMKYNKEVTEATQGTENSNMSDDDVYKAIEKAYNEGYFIIVRINCENNTDKTHFLCVVSVDTTNKKVYVNDVAGYSGQTKIVELFSEYGKKGGTRKHTGHCSSVRHVDRLDLFKTSKGGIKDFDLANGVTPPSTTTTGEEAVEKALNSGLSKYIKELHPDHTLNEYNIAPSDVMDLDPNTRHRIDEIQGFSESGNGIIHNIRVATILFGMLLVVYSVLLYLAFWFDRMNNILEFSMLKLMTFGRLETAPDEDEYNGATEKKYMTVKGITIRCLVGLFLGIFVMSGKLFQLIYSIIKFISVRFI